MTRMASGKTVAITGGGGGIGKALGQRFGEAGARVALLDRDEDALVRAGKELRGRGIEVHTRPCDITDESSCEEAVSAVREALGGLDVLAHCAGLTQVSPFEKTKLEVYRRVMEVNFFGVVACTKAALPSLIEARGQIIVLSSIAGFAPLLGRTGYCASKHALHGFFDTLRAELRREGVSVLLVCPSFVDTNFAKRGLGGEGKILTFDRSTMGTPLSTGGLADAIFRATAKRKRFLVVPGTGKLAYLTSRLLPRVYERGMSKRFQVELDREDGDG